ncbi:hypothetical protein GTGU_01905 [Trabulsiella guamensis ATCC 49490]|uniref:Uncharacterized protein n=1 Tax=Trabulsiella guamensis ATCC 49490 TaxID=1005994 RepID=A0A085AAS0_9ENTR|nr:hypothetical protein GTGU_01905 [Trabulsiella guamensis ATCC 49490]
MCDHSQFARAYVYLAFKKHIKRFNINVLNYFLNDFCLTFINKNSGNNFILWQ